MLPTRSRCPYAHSVAPHIVLEYMFARSVVVHCIHYKGRIEHDMVVEIYKDGVVALQDDSE